ncbi:MAG: disulfide bond formation protein B, partial [Acetobacteraceae bacterium]
RSNRRSGMASVGRLQAGSLGEDGPRFGPRTLGLGAAVVALAALAVALGSQRWGGLIACPLCLLERWPYRIAAALGIAAALLPPRLARPVLWLVVLTFAAGAAIAFVHVGVEQRWWKSPLPECNAPPLTAGSLSAMLANLPAHPSKSCADPTYLIPGLPVSMALMDLLYALGAAGLLACFLRRWEHAR